MERGGDRILVTGGAGFVGSALVRHLLTTEPATEVRSFDLLTYAGHRENLEGLPDPSRHALTVGDVADAAAVDAVLEDFAPTAVVHVAAETHVDQSLLAPARFVRTNVLGVQVLLDACRARGVRLVNVSTDEVYGSLPEGEAAGPERALRPSSPYAASKAAGDLLALAAARSLGQDVVTTRCTNNLGPRQLPEKLVPLMVLRAHAGAELPVYGDGLQVRDWIHVDDHAAGLRAALRRAEPGSVHHLAGRAPRRNLEVVERILALAGAPGARIRHVADRPAHDRRYALDDEATRRSLGWTPRVDPDRALEDTVAWYLANPGWCARVCGPELRAFLERNYAGR